MKKQELDSINKQMKTYINESTGISSRCRDKLIKLVEKHFYVELPHENYLNIDITILENGNIIMRDDEYQTKTPLSKSDSLINRYSEFQKEVDTLLDKNETNFSNKKEINEIKNIIILLFILLIIIFVFFKSVELLLYRDLYGIIWLSLIIIYYIIPITGNRLKERFLKAKNYLKNKFTKK